MAEAKDKALAGYEVLLCLTGGIACYKVADLTSRLVQVGAGVNVAMTESAQKFITPLTFQSLIWRPVYTSTWQSSAEFRAQHISLTELADLMIVAPATANILGKMANGIADDLVSQLALSASGECPILIAPAMNTRMWNAPAMQANIGRLRQWGVSVVGPEEGRLACGTIGEGRMIEPEHILKSATELLRRKPPKLAAENRQSGGSK